MERVFSTIKNKTYELGKAVGEKDLVLILGKGINLSFGLVIKGPISSRDNLSFSNWICLFDY